MQSVYLIVFTILGGVLALFGFAGWSSYQEKKLPDYASMFRSFLAGIVAAGLAAYTWIFGFNGNPNEIFEKVSSALEVKETLESLTKAAGGSGGENPNTSESTEELKIGMPNF